MATLLSYALCTKADVKELLGIDSSDTTKDNLIIRKINQATRAIEAYCGRRFKATTYTNVEYNGTYTDEIVLRQRPVISFTNYGVRDTSLNESDWEDVDSNLYFVDETAGVLKLNFRAIGKWDRYRVSYTAGYYTIPEDLAEACASLAAYYVQNADSSQVGVIQKQEGQRSIRYSDAFSSSATFPDLLGQLGIDQIISSYANYPVMTDR